MLKQLFKNAFKPKDAKFGYNLYFVSALKNHNEVKEFEKGKCSVTFENRTMTIQQGDNIIVEKMSNVSSIRTWAYKRRYLIIEFNTKNHNEYKFSLEMSNNIANGIVIKTLTRYADALNIPLEYCGITKDDDETDI